MLGETEGVKLESVCDLHMGRLFSNEQQQRAKSRSQRVVNAAAGRHVALRVDLTFGLSV